jgi:hypothetical protein
MAGSLNATFAIEARRCRLTNTSSINFPWPSQVEQVRSPCPWQVGHVTNPVPEQGEQVILPLA